MPLGGRRKAVGGAHFCSSTAPTFSGRSCRAVAEQDAIQHSSRRRRGGLRLWRRRRHRCAAAGMVRLEATGDCLIGADGARSLVRDRLLGAGADSAGLAKWIAWRALIRADRAPPRGAAAEFMPLARARTLISCIIPCAAAPSSMSSRFSTPKTTPARAGLVERGRSRPSSPRAFRPGTRTRGRCSARRRLAQMAPHRSDAAAAAGRRGARAPRRRRPSHAAFPGPGRRPGDRGRRRAGRSASGDARYPRRSPPTPPRGAPGGQGAAPIAAQGRIYHLSGPAAFARDAACAPSAAIACSRATIGSTA